MEEMNYVTRNGVRLAYRKRGEGPPVVLVQGLGLSSQMWLALPDRLVEQGFSVVTLDNRGSGESDRPQGPYTMMMLADDVAEVINAAGTGAAIVMGISLGGMIVQSLTIRHPRLVKGLILASTTCGMPLGRLASPFALAHLFKATVTDTHNPKLIWHSRTIEEHPEVIERFRTAVATDQRRGGRLLGQLGAVLSYTGSLRLREISCPVEVVTGDSDVIIPPVNSEILAKLIPNAKLTVIPEAGHGFGMEHPKVLPELIKKFADRLETA